MKLLRTFIYLFVLLALHIQSGHTISFEYGENRDTLHSELIEVSRALTRSETPSKWEPVSALANFLQRYFIATFRSDEENIEQNPFTEYSHIRIPDSRAPPTKC